MPQPAPRGSPPQDERPAADAGPTGTPERDADQTPAEPPRQRSTRRDSAYRIVVKIVEGVRDADPKAIEATVVELSGTRRALAPLGFVAGTLALVVSGVKPLIANWRLTLIEVAPAAWIWVSMWNLKAHILDERQPRHIHHGAVLILLVLLVIGVATAAFFCNAVFAFAVGGDPPPKIRPAARLARQHFRPVLMWGVIFGSAQALVLFWISRFGNAIYDVTLSIVVVAMMASFVAVPAAILGQGRQQRSTKDKVGSAAIGGVLSGIAATPGFLLDRIGLLLIGVQSLRILGFVLLSVGVALQVAGTSSVRAVKLSTRLGRHE